MQSKTIVLALCSVLAVGALIPAVQAAHYTMYHTADMHQQMASFETRTTDAANKNGPAVDDTRAIPNSGPEAAEIPAAFRPATAIVDKLDDATRTRGTGFGLVMDHVLSGSAVESGTQVPYQYYLANAVGQSRTTPSSMHALWHGYWNDLDADGIIDDGYCLSGGACGTTYKFPQTGVCPGAACFDLVSNGLDEFQWRGKNSGDPGLSAPGWFFPGDYNGASGTGGKLEPAALSGDCAKFDSVSCLDPAPDMTFSDETDPTVSSNVNNQRWSGGTGGGQWTPEEFLVVTQHFVALIGPPGAITDSGSAANYKVDLTSGDFFRDYDWYQSSLPAVESLYRSAVTSDHTVASETVNLRVLWVSVWDDQADSTPCPKALGPCDADDRHTTLSTQKATTGYAKASFTEIDIASGVPYALSTPSAGPVPAQGFYGDVALGTDDDALDVLNPGFVRADVDAWLWDDKNGDGFIGAPNAIDLLMWNNGLSGSPNTGVCDPSTYTGTNLAECEVVGRTDIYSQGAAVFRLTPGASGWPAGSVYFRDYDREANQINGGDWPFCGTSSCWIAGQPSAGASVLLRPDPLDCKSGNLACRSRDAVVIPTGNIRGLTFEVLGDGTNVGISMSWTEGTNTRTVAGVASRTFTALV